MVAISGKGMDEASEFGGGERLIVNGGLGADDAEAASLELLISIRPEHADSIVEGLKTVEFRRRFPPEQRVRGATVWIYSTAPVREVIGTAVVVSVDRMGTAALWHAYGDRGAVSRGVFDDYFSGVSEGHAISLGGVRRLGTPVDAARLEALDFATPQSYRFVPEDVSGVLRRCLDEAPA